MTCPKGCQASAVSGSAVTVRMCSSPIVLSPVLRVRLEGRGRSPLPRLSYPDAHVMLGGAMDVRSIENVAPVVEHNGTVPVWWLVNPREMKDITDGGHLELVSEFEVAGGGLVDPHEHPTH